MNIMFVIYHQMQMMLCAVNEIKTDMYFLRLNFFYRIVSWNPTHFLKIMLLVIRFLIAVCIIGVSSTYFYMYRVQQTKKCKEALA